MLPALEAPRLGFEPRTYRLTAGRSTIELSGIVQTAQSLPQLLTWLATPSATAKYERRGLEAAVRF